MLIRIIHGDMLVELPKLDADSIDSVVTDPPYHLTSIVKRFGGENAAPAKGNDAYLRLSKGFMGKQWDGGDIALRPETWEAVWRVLKPGAHLLAFGGTRTFHRMACAIEDAGFEIRDTIAWLYGSGFPKSLDVSKAIDKAAGAEREVIGKSARHGGGVVGAGTSYEMSPDVPDITTPATPESAQWSGWGTALKPAAEYICVAQKPYTTSQETEMMGSIASALERQLWSLLPANVAERNFGLSLSEHVAACVSAPWSAEQRSNTLAALSAQMDTSLSASALISSLNTVSSWRGFLAEILIPENTSTTVTGSSTTIDLRTLKSCLLRITPESIILAHRSGQWSNADAEPAVRYFNACVSKWNATRELSALECAFAQDATNCRGEDGFSPDLELICVARKPLSERTVAANVLRHGTGAINVDACRVEVADGDVRSGGFGEGNRPWVEGDIGGNTIRKGSETGRWPANVCLSYPDDEYILKPDVTSEQRRELYRWLHENS